MLDPFLPRYGLRATSWPLLGDAVHSARREYSVSLGVGQPIRGIPSTRGAPKCAVPLVRGQDVALRPYLGRKGSSIV